MAEIYWRNGYRGASVISASDAHKELEKIRKKNGGELDPQSVVDAATSSRNKLHKCFRCRCWKNGAPFSKHACLVEKRLQLNNF